MWEGVWGLVSACQGTNVSISKGKGTAHTGMKGVREQTMVLTLAAFEVGCFETFFKKMMNKLKVWPLCP